MSEPEQRGVAVGSVRIEIDRGPMFGFGLVYLTEQQMGLRRGEVAFCGHPLGS